MTKPARIPTHQEVRDRLGALSTRARAALSKLSGVPPQKLKNIRLGVEADPRLSTLHQFWPHLDAVRKR
jgi:hypothetical protein